MHLDLHVHSTCSDGALAPAEVVAAAQRAGLAMIALADHDTTAGVEPARAAAAALGGIGIITATELTCLRDGTEVHLLGYGFRSDDAGLAAITRRAAALRRERMAAMVERLQRLGVRLSAGDVTVEPECTSIGRMHLARALVRLGAAGSVQDAFARYIGDRAPAWVPSRGPEVAEAIAALTAAGGCPVWAHPSLEDAIRSFRSRMSRRSEIRSGSLERQDPVRTSAMERGMGVMSKLFTASRAEESLSGTHTFCSLKSLTVRTGTSDMI